MIKLYNKKTITFTYMRARAMPFNNMENFVNKTTYFRCVANAKG